MRRAITGSASIAARVSTGIARGGQILLSSATAELIHDDLPAGVTLRDLGERQLKDIDRPERVYQVLADGLPAEVPSEEAGRRPHRRLRIGAAGGVVAIMVAAAVVILGTRGSSGPTAASAAVVSGDSVGIFNPSSGHLSGQFPVGVSPNAVTAGDGSLWVTNVNAHSVSRIDPAKQVVIQTFQVGNGPDAIAYGGGSIWVANGLDATVTEINPETNTVVDAAIPVGNGPAGVAADSRYVWVANSSDGTVTRIDERTDEPLASIDVGQSADGIAVEDGSAWVTSEVSGTVTRIDASGNVTQSVTTGSGASAVAVGPDAIWVANNLDGTVTGVDPTSSKGPVTIAVGDGPNGIAVDASGVWVSNELAGTLSRIDPTRDVVVRTVTTGNRPEGVVVTSGKLFVTVRASGAGHRGGTLTMLTGAGGFGSEDPVLSGEWQVFALTNDGLTGFQRVGGTAGTKLVNDLAVSLPSPTDAGRSYTFQLRPGIRYSTGALVRPQDFRSTIERTLELGDPGLDYGLIVGARRCAARPGKPCDLSKGIVTNSASNTVTFHLIAPDPNFLYELALPYVYVLPAGTPLHPRGPLPATGPYEIAAGSTTHGVRLVRNPEFREWSQAAQPSGFPSEIVERYGGSPDAHATPRAGMSSRCSTPSATTRASGLRSSTPS